MDVLTPEWLAANAVSALAIGLAPYPADRPNLVRVARWCRSEHIPLISVHAENSELTDSCVLIDNAAAGEEVAQYIVDVDGPICYLGILNGSVDLARLNGLQAAMRKHGRSDLLVEALLDEIDSDGLEALFARVFSHRPGAIFLAFPPLYTRLRAYMLRHGHAVKLAVFAECANAVRGDLWPTAVAEKPSRQLGTAAVQMLDDLLTPRAQTAPARRVLRCHIHPPFVEKGSRV
jgi:DNA-binding LacI/PurR family transcriptional regulator